jgi:hypothetical protein
MRRHVSRPSVQRVPALSVDLLEERLPVSESFGTALTVALLSGAAYQQMGQTPLSLSVHAVETVPELGMDAVHPLLEGPTGLTESTRITLLASRPDASNAGQAVDALFAELYDQPLVPVEGEGDSGQAASHGMGFVSPAELGPMGYVQTAAGMRALPAGQDGFAGGTALLSRPVNWAEPPYVAAPVLGAPPQDRSLQQTVATAAVAPAPNSPSAALPQPSIIVPANNPVVPAGGGFNPPPPTVTGTTGLIPELECGGCSKGDLGPLRNYPLQPVPLPSRPGDPGPPLENLPHRIDFPP